jgi:hypothetical protein
LIKEKSLSIKFRKFPGIKIRQGFIIGTREIIPELIESIKTNLILQKSNISQVNKLWKIKISKVLMKTP